MFGFVIFVFVAWAFGGLYSSAVRLGDLSPPANYTHTVRELHLRLWYKRDMIVCLGFSILIILDYAVGLYFYSLACTILAALLAIAFSASHPLIKRKLQFLHAQDDQFWVTQQAPKKSLL